MSISPSPTPLTLEDIRIQIAEIIAAPPDEIGLDDRLVDRGLDSLRLLRLITLWDEQTGMQLDLSELAGQLTLEALWTVIKQRQAHT